jgi:hypothetical protein
MALRAGKVAGTVAAVVVLFSFLMPVFITSEQFQPIEQAQPAEQFQPSRIIDENLMYIYLSRFTVRLSGSEPSGWVYIETRDFQFRDPSHWWAKKWQYSNNATLPCGIKLNGNLYNETLTVVYLLAGMEESNNTAGCYNSLFISLGANEDVADKEKYSIWLDSVFACGSYRKEVWYNDPNGTSWKIMDYPEEKSVVGTNPGKPPLCIFYDTLFPDQPFRCTGAAWIPNTECDYSFSQVPDPTSLNNTLLRLGVKCYAWNGSGWSWIYDRYRFETGKWWVTMQQYAEYPSVSCLVQKQLMSVEVSPTQAFGMHDNLADLVVSIVHEVNLKTSQLSRKLEFVQACGAFKLELYWEQHFLDSGIWKKVFEEWYPTEDSYHTFAYDVPLE